MLQLHKQATEDAENHEKMVKSTLAPKLSMAPTTAQPGH